MTEYKIEKRIPISSAKKGISKYPFHQMEVGDSFLFVGKRSIIAASVHVFGKRNKKGKKFIVSAVDGGYRVWRIK